MYQTPLLVGKCSIVTGLPVSNTVIDSFQTDERGCEQPREVRLSALETPKTAQLRKVRTGETEPLWGRFLAFSTCGSAGVFFPEYFLRTLLSWVGLVGVADETENIFLSQLIGVVFAELLDGLGSKQC